MSNDKERGYDSEIWDRLSTILQDLSRQGDWFSDAVSEIVEELLDSARKLIDDILRVGSNPSVTRALGFVASGLTAMTGVEVAVALRHAIDAAEKDPPIVEAEIVVQQEASVKVVAIEVEQFNGAPALNDASEPVSLRSEEAPPSEPLEGYADALRPAQAAPDASPITRSDPASVELADALKASFERLDFRPATAAAKPAPEVLIGTAGDDVIVGGTGNDVIIGGAGADTFVFGEEIGRDVITDLSKGDVIVFEAHYESFEEVMQDARASGDDVVIHVTRSDRITIQGVDLKDLDESYFLFS